MKLKKLKLPIFLILATSLPFLLLLLKVDWSLWNSDREFFWIDFVAVISNIFGFLGIMILYWQFILGSRFIAKYLSKDILELNKLHQFLGKYGFLLVIAHPMLERINYVQDYLWVMLPNLSSQLERHITIGRIAYFSFVLVWLTSAFLRKRMKYRPWLYIHYITYPALLLIFFHSLEIGRYLQEYKALALLWVVMGGLYGIFLCIRILYFLGYLQPKYKLVKKQKVGEDIVLLTFKALGKTISQPKAGQYAYLKAKQFGEAHPFTIMKFSSDEITFGIKQLGKFSKEVTALEEGSQVFIDGPYGEFTVEGHNDKLKVAIAGGIGITPFVSLLSKYGNKNSTLLYANQNSDVVIEHELFASLDINYKSFISREEGIKQSNMQSGRLDKKNLHAELSDELLKHANFFLCGSQRFLEGMRENLFQLGVDKSRIYVEEFTS